MKKLPASNDPCPYCGRAMKRPTSERLIEPLCRVCLPERIAKAEQQYMHPVQVPTAAMLFSGKYI